jgi:hypothetical protein
MASAHRDGNEGRVGELLSAVVANAVAVPAVLGFVVLGAATIVGRSLVELASHQLRRRAPARGASKTGKGRSKASTRRRLAEPRSTQP